MGDFQLDDEKDLRRIKEMLALYGPWTAEVVENDKDPDKSGVIAVKIPELFGDKDVVYDVWPKFPVNVMELPKPGQFTYIEFQHLDRNNPIWSGQWWPDQKKHPDMNGKPDRHIWQVVNEQNERMMTVKYDEGKEFTIKDNRHGSRISLNIESGEINIFSDEGSEGGNSAPVNINGKKANLTGDPAARMGDETTHICMVLGTPVKGIITQGCARVILNNERR